MCKKILDCIAFRRACKNNWLVIGALAAICLSFSKLHAIELLPEVRAAYYYPTDHRFRDIYSDAALYSVEMSVEGWNNLYPWGSLGFLYASGSTIGEDDKTHLYVIPLGLGLKYFFHWKQVHPYLGAGVVIAFAHIHTDSSFMTRNQSDWGRGGIAKLGLLADITNSLFLDFFIDYTFLRMSFNHSNNKDVDTRRGDLSGLSIGGGIGYRF